ncbi:hypothetical protein LTR66_006895 [Elasticomyces elasticus]|nr:hypothetical protein LTR66_006895 [Elasticomyces elasticus]
MRINAVLLALPVLAAADQVPLLDQAKGWLAKASSAVSSYIPSGSEVKASIPSALDAGAAKLASAAVTPLTLQNYKDTLKAGPSAASSGPDEWLVFVTGGNKSCYGLCGPAESAWHASVPLLSASKSPPYLGSLNCETEPVLCNAWALTAPSLLHMLLPRPLPDQSMPATTVRYIPVNRTSVTTMDIVKVHTQETYLNVEPYDGFWHPFDGTMARLGLNEYIGRALWVFGVVPSWMFMLAVSFFSRSFVRRPAARPAGAPAATQ